MGTRVLVIDDEPKLLRLVRAVLQMDGFEVDTADDGATGMELFKSSAPDLLLLDISLPGNFDGFSLCRWVRERSRVPIIMLTARAEENDKIRGFDAGADDYLTKPFSSRELVARVKAVLRRSNRPDASGETGTVACGDLVVDMAQRRVSLRGEEVLLTATEYKLLTELAKNCGRVMLHSELLERVWGPEYVEQVDYLRAYVRSLRRKIEDSPAAPRYLLSRPGIGYVLGASKTDADKGGPDTKGALGTVE